MDVEICPTCAGYGDIYRMETDWKAEKEICHTCLGRGFRRWEKERIPSPEVRKKALEAAIEAIENYWKKRDGSSG